MVHYEGLIAPLIEAVKELHARLQRLEAEARERGCQDQRHASEGWLLAGAPRGVQSHRSRSVGASGVIETPVGSHRGCALRQLTELGVSAAGVRAELERRLGDVAIPERLGRSRRRRRPASTRSRLTSGLSLPSRLAADRCRGPVVRSNVALEQLDAHDYPPSIVRHAARCSALAWSSSSASSSSRRPAGRRRGSRPFGARAECRRSRTSAGTPDG